MEDCVKDKLDLLSCLNRAMACGRCKDTGPQHIMR